MNKGFIIAIIFILGAAAIGVLLYFVQQGNVPVSQQSNAQFPAVSQQIINPSPVVPVQKLCEDYYKSDCPDSCLICSSQQDGTIEEATCHTKEFCTSLGFDENWYVDQVNA